MSFVIFKCGIFVDGIVHSFLNYRDFSFVIFFLLLDPFLLCVCVFFKVEVRPCLPTSLAHESNRVEPCWLKFGLYI